jgi:hypothetical protein
MPPRPIPKATSSLLAQPSDQNRNSDYVSNNRITLTNSDIATLQDSLCKERGYGSVLTSLDSKLGFAITTQGRVPINGLRLVPTGYTNGWYIWCGEELSQVPDFFAPLHTLHLLERCPETIPFLGLPPGCRFLLEGDHIDVWYDESLLKV